MESTVLTLKLFALTLFLPLSLSLPGAKQLQAKGCRGSARTWRQRGIQITFQRERSGTAPGGHPSPVSGRVRVPSQRGCDCSLPLCFRLGTRILHSWPVFCPNGVRSGPGPEVLGSSGFPSLSRCAEAQTQSSRAAYFSHRMEACRGAMSSSACCNNTLFFGSGSVSWGACQVIYALRKSLSVERCDLYNDSQTDTATACRCVRPEYCHLILINAHTHIQPLCQY